MDPNNTPNQPFQNPGTPAAQPQAGGTYAPNGTPGQQFVPQQPVAYPQQMGQTPLTSSAPFVAGTSATISAKPPRRGRKWLALGLAAVVVIVAAVAYFALKKPSNNNGSGSAANTNTSASSSKLASQLQSLGGFGSKLQASDLSKLNKTSLFYAVLKNAAEQNVVTTTNDTYLGASPSDQTTRQDEFLHQSTFNYKTKALAQETQDPTHDYDMRCVNGKNYTYDYINGMGWQAASDTSASCTDPNSYNSDINDGINSGGMTAAQAQTFVGTIAGASGLISVDSMSYVTHDNAPYIRLAVTVHPVKLADGTYQGMGVIIGAFEKTGLNADTWPYEAAGTLATGAQLIYYVNPATQLPAYSQIGLTYYIDSGKQYLNDTYTFQDTQYSFGGSVQPLSLTGAPAQLKLAWPEEQF